MTTVLFQRISVPLHRFILLPLLITYVMNVSYAENYIIRPTKTQVSFAIERFKSSATTGGFYNVQGQLQYNPNLKTGYISLIIPIKSLNTGNRAFNSKLTGPDFFNAQEFPLAHFKSTNWYFDQDNNNPQVVRVEGNLTMHGETHPIRLTATQFECYLATTFKNEICAGNFTTTIDRTKWNINKFSLFGLTKNLNLKVQIEAMKQSL